MTGQPLNLLSRLFLLIAFCDVQSRFTMVRGKKPGTCSVPSKWACPDFVRVDGDTFDSYRDSFLLLLLVEDESDQSLRFVTAWKSLADEFYTDRIPVTLGVMDSSKNPKMEALLYVEHFPSLFLYHKGGLVAHLKHEKSKEQLKLTIARLIRLNDTALAERKHNLLQKLKENESEWKRISTIRKTSTEFEKVVTMLDEANFYSLTSDKDTLAFVFQFRCEQCDKLKAEWLQLLEETDIYDLMIAVINFDEFRAFPGSILLASIPSVLFFRNSEVYGFSDVQNVEQLLDWGEFLASLHMEELKEFSKHLKTHEATRKRELKEASERYGTRTDKEFEELMLLSVHNLEELTKNRSVLVLFYKWKEALDKTLKDIWVTVAKEHDLSGRLIMARFPETDCRTRPDKDKLAEIYQFVHEYPTILLVRNGYVIERYEGRKTWESLFFYAFSLVGLAYEDAKLKYNHLYTTLLTERQMGIEGMRVCDESVDEDAIRSDI